MSDLTEDLLLLIQKAVAAETGVSLERDAALRLYSALVKITSSRVLRQDGQSQEVTVLMSDLRGFAAISEANPPRVVLEALNQFLSRMCEIAIDNGGTIDKFMGDAVMVLFGAPVSRADDARRAVTCAVQMQIAMEEINRGYAELEFPAVYMGTGINTGQVMAGTLGSNLYSEYTVIGEEVNIASRIEAFSVRGQVLISEATFDRCQGFVTVGDPMDVHVKGKSKLVRLREVLAVPSLNLTVPRQDVRKGPRVEARLPFTYKFVVGKVVIPPRCKGVVLDISYEGLLAEVEPGASLYAEINVELDLSLVGGAVHNLYARVLSLRTDGPNHFAGIEFTSVSPKAEHDIRHLVQLLIQGSPLK